MAINIKFDTAGNPEPPTIVLATRSGKKLGQLNVDQNSIELNDRFNDASEFSFTLYKYYFDEKEQVEKITNLWDKVVNFKLVWCKEWEMWFEITVELDEETETIKTVFCKQLGQAELSQLKLYNIEINTEKDIARDDYKITILYNEEDTEASMLHRLLKDKAPHYSIAHVDSTIAKIQRTFSFDDTSIYDALMEISEEIGCLFIFHSNSDENGNILRAISVYDLQQNCLNPDCKHRGEFIDKCPKCEGKNDNGEEFGIEYGYGEDTSIFVTSDELASDGIQLTTDTDSVKNCFKLEAGDDLMTATVRNCNPNGTDYIWRFSDSMKSDMSKELVDKIDSYDVMYKEYYNNHKSELNSDMLNKYNELVKKYEEKYNINSSTCLSCDYKGNFIDICPECKSNNVISKHRLEEIPSAISGYSALMNAYYDTIDFSLYLESSLMPTIDIGVGQKLKAADYVNMLTSSSLSPVAVNVDKIDSVSESTADNAIALMAKIIVPSIYKIEVKSSYLSDDKIWTGNFEITNYSDETDTAVSDAITVQIVKDDETLAKQRIEKALSKLDTEDYSISGLFEKEIKLDENGNHIVNADGNCECEFCKELKNYALKPLQSFYDACESCLTILQEQGIGNDGANKDLYKKLYLPYTVKSQVIADEIFVRENELSLIKGVYDETDEENKVLKTKGIQQYIDDCKIEIQDKLNFEKYIGEDLWLEFCAYRREDKYSNDNYTSDGLNNAQLFNKAKEFVEVAEKEIYKASESQHSISTSLNNLLAIKKFKPLINSFNLGNWIRVRVNDEVYRLRLLEYGISFGDFNNMPVEFSDVTKIKNGITDVENILSQASSMATNYTSIQRQAKHGNEAKETVDDFITHGLNTALVQIQNNNNEDITLTKDGLLCRSYNDITDDYSPEQLKITHNIFAYTDDGWKTVRQAIGKHDYKIFSESENKFVNMTGYGMTADFVTAGVVSGSQIIGGDIYSDNYPETDGVPTGSYLNLLDGTFSFAGGRLSYKDGYLSVDGNIKVTNSGKIGCWDVNSSSIYKDSESWGSSSGMYFGTDGLSLGSAFKVKPDGSATASNLELTGGRLKVGDYFEVDKDGVLTSSSGTIGGWKISSDSLYSNVTTNRSGMCSSSSKYAFWAGENNSAIGASNTNAKFKVSHSGVLTATGANVSGSVTATSGVIGSLNIISSVDESKYMYGNGLYVQNSGIPLYMMIDDGGSSSGGGSASFAQFTTVNVQGQFGIKPAIDNSHFFMYYNIKSPSMSAWNHDSTATIFGVKGDGSLICSGLTVYPPKSLVIPQDNNGTYGDPYYPDGSWVIKTSESRAIANDIRVNSIEFKNKAVYSNIVCDEDAGYNLGTESVRWNTVYAKEGVKTSSDIRFKKDVCCLTNIHKEFFMKLIPSSYVFIDSKDGKTHVGFIAQEVENAMLECGLDNLDFAGLSKDIKTEFDDNDEVKYIYDSNGNPEYIYSLNYSEFIGIITYVLQDTVNRLDKVEALINKLINN